MEFRQLNTFIQVAQHKSFSQAAKSLGITQSAVTIQIKNLEEELGTRLFDRIGKQTKITAKGEEFQTYATNILEQMNNAVHSITQDSVKLHGVLRIGVNESICAVRIPEVVSYFANNHPEVKLRIYTGTPDYLYQMMEKNQIDLVYVLDLKRCQDNWIKATEKQEPICFVCSSESELAGKDQLSIRDVIDQPFYLTEPNQNYRFAFDHLLARDDLVVHPVLECMNTQLLLKIIQSNPGLCLLPYYTVKELQIQGKVSILKIKDYDINMYCQVFYHKDKWKTPEMEAFIQFIKNNQ